MMPNQSELVAFTFVDPLKLRQGLDRNRATVMTILAVYTGDVQAIVDEKLNGRSKSRIMNSRLTGMVHRIADRRRLERSRTEGGPFLLFYCSRCARPFRTNTRCAYCKIDFTLKDLAEGLASRNAPTLPPRISRYVRQQGMVFKYAPPSS